MLSVVMLNVVVLNVGMLIIGMLNVIMLSVITLSVVAPRFQPTHLTSKVDGFLAPLTQFLKKT